ncbi:MAG: hypothetical protein ACU0AZ_17405 [Paracoccaceae bacterium]
MEVRFDGVKKTDPTNHEGFKVSYAGAKRAGFRWRWRIMILVVISPILIWSYLLLQQQFLVSADGIMTTEPIQVRASKSGFVSGVLVEAGQEVDVNQPMFSMSSPEIDRRIELWQKSLEQLVAYRETMIENLGSALVQYEAKLAESRQRQDDIAGLYGQLEDKGLFTLSDQMQLNEMRRALSSDEHQHMVDRERLESLRHTVRRQSFWNQGLPNLSESSAHLVDGIMRRVCGVASVALRRSFV